METIQIKDFLNSEKEKMKQVVIQETQVIAAEIAEREWELMELKLFISSAGKERLDEAAKAVKDIRILEKQGNLNLKEFEEIAEEF